MRHHTLYVTDMDGTLLDNNSRVSAESASIISDLTDDGALVTVATARTPATVDPLLATTRISCPAIVLTGAALWDNNRKIMTRTHLMESDIAESVLEAFNRHGVDPFVYTVVAPSHLDVYHGHYMNRAEEKFYTERRNLQLKQFRIGHKVPPQETGSIILMFAIGDTARLKRLGDELIARGDCAVSCYPDIHLHDTALIEVFARGVSKARAVSELACEVGADRIVAFGDNLNDLPMLEIADVAVAVDNAFPRVKEQAHVVIGSNASHAVARFMHDDFHRVQ